MSVRRGRLEGFIIGPWSGLRLSPAPGTLLTAIDEGLPCFVKINYAIFLIPLSFAKRRLLTLSVIVGTLSVT